MNMCYHPWIGLDISPQGEFKPCCKYKNVLASTVDDYRNSKELETLKKEFIDGKKPIGCFRCWRDENSGIQSKRQLDNQYILNNSKPDLSSIKILSLAFGNTCNLACRICSNYASSRWGLESKKLKKSNLDTKIFNNGNFYRNKELMSDLKKFTKDIIHLDVPGGEPFLSDWDVHLDFLNNINKIENTSVHYTTNGLIFPREDILKTLLKFKKVDIQLSIDGINYHYEYNRWPGLWTDFLKNIPLYLKLKNDNSNIQLSISHTVSIFTIYYLPEFLEFLDDNKLPFPYLGLLTNPSYYDITVLSEHTKKIIENKLKNNSKLVPIINAMWAKDNSDLLPTTFKYIKIIDNQRNQKFQDCFFELYNSFDNNTKKIFLSI